MLRLDDFWVWDSWAVDDGERYHLFFLQAPRSLGDQNLRHVNARVGHASSTDLVSWTYHGECLGPSGSGFDDRAIWTGSVVRAQERWWMFYTALAHGSVPELGQRIGCAVSDDLFTWERVSDRPVVDVDPAWYRVEGGASETWRDPLVLPDGDGGWHMLVTAREKGGAEHDDGVVGHATSPDLRTWTVRPPRCRGGAGFGELEVLQSKVIDGRPVLVFTCHPHSMTPAKAAATGHFCTWSVPGPSVVGPWDIVAARPFVADPDLFAAPLVQLRDGSWVIVGFRNLESQGRDGLFIHDPIPVGLDDEGYLRAI
jgi:beta-fructofuranosidase